MGKKYELAGEKYGRLTAISDGGKRGKNGEVYWVFHCDCGNNHTARARSVIIGTTKSCGCLQKEMAKGKAKHGHLSGYRHSPEYATWRAMLRRCKDIKFSDYYMYGGRGIKVCDRWNDFLLFLEDVGDRPEGMTLDRFPNKDGDYEPGNVRWSTPKEQARNMRANRIIEFDGKKMCVAEWADALGIDQNTIRARLFNGWSGYRALSVPVRAKKLNP
jgi:hypothetical protein